MSEITPTEREAMEAAFQTERAETLAPRLDSHSFNMGFESGAKFGKEQAEREIAELETVLRQNQSMQWSNDACIYKLVFDGESWSIFALIKATGGSWIDHGNAPEVLDCLRKLKETEEK